MVAIRKLELPTRPPGFRSKPQRSQKKVVLRRLVDFPAPTPQPTPCRLWQGAVDKDGYGRMKVRKPDGRIRTLGVHRWVVEQGIGRGLRKQQFVLHLCDNPPCYRFSHLRVGTVQDNNADMKAKGRDSKPPVNRLHGASNGRAKLTERDAEVIRKLYLQGISAETMAKSYGVSASTIRKITKGLSWRHNTVDLLEQYRSEE